MKYPQTLQNLMECFQKLPGIGEKTAERLALSTLKFDQNIIDVFSKSLTDVKIKIRKCEKCNNLSEGDLCEICKDGDRDKEVLCVVEDPKNIILFEKLGTFGGYYHVINGLISPLDGINPEDIQIPELIERIKNEKIKEVILAVKPSVEGETTSLYISKMLAKTNVLVSKIAHGIPLGAEIDYVDALTLELALENRKKISNDD
jgi:recombination protein RecR